MTPAIEFRNLQGSALHDFPYPPKRRKCPHYALVSITESGCCIHKCPVCYARAYLWSADDRLVLYQNLPEKIDRELSQLQIAPPLYLSQITDCLQPVSEIRELTVKIIRVILRHQVSFHLVTKSADGPFELIERIPELLTYPYWYLSMTIEATPEKQEITSTFASPIEQRLWTLRKLCQMKMAITARTDPFLLGLMKAEDALWLVQQIAKTGVKHIVSSTGYFNRISMRRVLEVLEKSKWRENVPQVLKAYRCNEELLISIDPKKRFTVDWQTKVRYHRWLRQKVESLGMTYAVCQELPKEFDSVGIRHCEGIERNFVHFKDKDGVFCPISDCFGDCLRSCPTSPKPPCGKKELLYQYPYRLKTLKMFNKRRQEKLFLPSGC
ncbi:MAG: hypothetical protein AB1393_10920 [Candidatus Edwardsbacteria bacterium]